MGVEWKKNILGRNYLLSAFFPECTKMPENKAQRLKHY